LHRWVLLKNSLSVFPPPSAIHPVPNDSTAINQLYPADNHDHNDDSIEETGTGHGDSFLFPDAGKLVSTSHSGGSEAQWLDTLLKALIEGEDEDEFSEPDVISSATPVDDDDDAPLSPLVSPMASSDDLRVSDSYFSPAVPYSVQYQPPLVLSHPDIDPSISSLQASYEDPLPYYNLDGAQDYSVPDTISEDMSDDESDVPSTPLFGRSSASLTLYDASSTSPSERHAAMHPYSDKDPFFFTFEVDPLPFSNAHHNSYNTYQQY